MGRPAERRHSPGIELLLTADSAVLIVWLGKKRVSIIENEYRVKNLRRVDMDVVRIIFAILLPPLGVFLQVGLGMHFWINILLTLLGYIPGIVHAVWIIAKK